MLTRGTKLALLAALLLPAVAALAESPAEPPPRPDADEGPLPQTLCPISGKPVDGQTAIVYGGQKIKLCCPGCDEEFLKDPEGYLAAMGDQGVIVESVQTVCPVSGKDLPGLETSVEYKGRRVYFCCPGCDEEFLKDPEPYLPRIK
jgi:YHS domain-containing protein